MKLEKLQEIILLYNDTWGSPGAVAAFVIAAVPVIAGAIAGIIKAIDHCDHKNGRTHSRITKRKFKKKHEPENPPKKEENE